nr:NmrA family NAD(P)-binding protein [Allomuricauda sp.]
MKSKILVLGGKGKTGRRVAEQLSTLGHTVRIGSRSENPAFDWDQPETWGKAMEGMDKMYITFQPDLAVPGALQAIEGLMEEAKRQNIQKVVLLSGKGEVEAERSEQVVINSGVAHTIVRASWFNQNFSESFFLEPIQHGFVALPHADVEVPYVDANDIAAVVVEALLNETHNGQIYELTGPRLLTFREIVRDISEVTGREIAFTPVSLPAYIKALEEQGVPADYVWLINYLFSEVLTNPDNQLVKHDIEKVLGRKPIDFSEYLEKTVATGVWNAREDN